jgi:hypothetical protein
MQFGDMDAVSVTTIRISTCDFWATNKGPSTSSTRATPSWRRIGSSTSGLLAGGAKMKDESPNPNRRTDCQGHFSCQLILGRP